MTDVSKTLEERGGRYGVFIDHATIAQNLQDVMRNAKNWAELDPDMRQALTVIADKIARILNGKAFYSDSWHDIAGYALLVDRRLKELEDKEKVPVLNGNKEELAAMKAKLDAALQEHKPKIQPIPNRPGYYQDETGALWGPPHDKASDPAYDVGNYRG